MHSSYFKKLEKSSNTASQPGHRQSPLMSRTLVPCGMLEETEMFQWCECDSQECKNITHQNQDFQTIFCQSDFWYEKFSNPYIQDLCIAMLFVA